MSVFNLCPLDCQPCPGWGTRGLGLCIQYPYVLVIVFGDCPSVHVLMSAPWTTGHVLAGKQGSLGFASNSLMG